MRLSETQSNSLNWPPGSATAPGDWGGLSTLLKVTTVKDQH